MEQQDNEHLPQESGISTERIPECQNIRKNANLMDDAQEHLALFLYYLVWSLKKKILSGLHGNLFPVHRSLAGKLSETLDFPQAVDSVIPPYFCAREETLSAKYGPYSSGAV